jgi:hypothetical protein
MARVAVRIAAALTMAVLAAGCSSPPPGAPGGPPDTAYDDNGPDSAGPGAPPPQGRSAIPGKPGEPERFSPVQMLLKFDADHDGKITKAELEAGLKADFAAADTSHDGKLDMDEVRAVNDARWKEQASAASPLVDWNGDGFVDFNEFAGAARSLFVQMDADGNGVLTPEELNPRQKPDKKGARPGGQGGPGGGQGGGQGGPGGGQGGPPPGH